MKKFNNLLTSIVLSVVLLISIASAIATFIWLDVPNMMAGYIAFSIAFAAIILDFVIVIIFGCYSYCILTDGDISLKKLFRKKVTIKVTEIEKIEIKSPSKFALDCYDAYVVFSATTKISINITFSTRKSLELYFSKFSHLLEDKRVKQEILMG